MVSDPGDNSTDNSDSVDICQEEGPTELFPEKHTKGYETRSNKTEMASSPDHVEAEERAFVDNLYRFMKDRGSPIERIPHLGFKQINLWKIYKAVEAMGGYDTVTGRRLWKNVYDELGGSPGSTSAATCTRKHYERLILPFERQLRGEEYKPLPQSKPRKLYKKSPDVKKSKAEGKTKRKVTQREEKTTTNKETAQRHPSSGFLQDRPQSHNNKQFGAHETSGFIKLESPRDVSLIVPSSGPAGVISPLEKKKLMAQASLCVLQNPKVVADCDSGGSTFVIHRSPPSPGVLTQGSARNSSDGSPLPPSSPSVSCSLSPSPGSVSSEEHPQQATEDTASGSVTDTKRGTPLKTPPVAVGHSAPRSPPPPPQSSHVLHKPLSRHPTRLESLHQRQGVFQTCSSSQLTATTLALDARKRYTSREIYTPPSEKQGQPSQHPVLKKNKMTPSWTSSASSFTRVVPRSRDVASPVSAHPFHKAVPLMFEPSYEAYMRHEQELRHQPRKTQTFSPLHSSVGKKDKGIHVWHGPLPLLHHSSIGLQVPYIGPEHHIKGLRSPHSFLSPTYLPIAHLNSHHQPLFMPAGASVPILHEYPLQSNPLTPPFGPPLAGHYPYSSNTRL